MENIREQQENNVQNSQRHRILAEADECICRNREVQYGDAKQNFDMIARLWTIYTGDHIYTPHEVAVMMALLKIARIQSGMVKADNYVDACGYIALAGEIVLTEVCEHEKAALESVRAEAAKTGAGIQAPYCRPDTWEKG
ncbi:MAG: DUF6378 domain-containing protein [Eubacteriales bacterium]